MRRYDRAPLIQPILFKTAFYWLVVFVARLLERLVHFLLEGHRTRRFPLLLGHDLFVAPVLCHLPLGIRPIPDLCDGLEFSHLFGPGELPRLFFTSRPSELQLNRRQRIRELMRLNRLADEHEVDAFAIQVVLRTTSWSKSLSVSRGRGGRNPSQSNDSGVWLKSTDPD